MYIPLRQRGFLALAGLAIGVHALLGFATYAKSWIDGLAITQSPVAYWLPPVLLLLAVLNLIAYIKQPAAGKV